MAPTRTIKNKHAANKSGIKGSKDAERSRNDGVLKSKGKPKGKAHTLVTANKGRPNIQELIARKQKKKKYSEKELAGLIPEHNMITPVGVSKPKGKKKGKVFVDDKVSSIIKRQEYGPIWPILFSSFLWVSRKKENTSKRLTWVLIPFTGEHGHHPRHRTSRKGGTD